ncbi:Protein sensitive to proton rhizotixicity 1 [Apostasia shenzhenica]|uniref:Protein sensitive to proton rhizotixicity 1 n=1 Tax=Apostasia shenzhenica TaxID=1088818 RepID=A0A2I0A5G0_9ASPA|nr:Protein sensitive to proton rhizotixicity 1 [Apostasia shenzhenica]
MISPGSRLTGGAAAISESPDSFTSIGVSVTDYTDGAPLPSEPLIPLVKLSFLDQKMESIRRFLSDSIDRRASIGGEQLQLISAEIASTVHQVIVNGSALIACSPAAVGFKISRLPTGSACMRSDDSDLVQHLPDPVADEAEADILEIDAVELMTERVHFCEICGKGFRRDANLRMHMRAHGDRFKTLESLSKPSGRVTSGGSRSGRPVLFSCPFPGCRRNQNHSSFRPLKTAVCVRNHFRRSHCPKKYNCDLCNSKSFSVVADLNSHRKSCGMRRWRCSCGTSFSRKDKLFGHVTQLEGHEPAVLAKEEKGKGIMVAEVDESRGGQAGPSLDDGFFDGLMEEIGGMGGGR